MYNQIEKLLLKNQPVIMGILNLTPDSFSDGQPHASTCDFFKKANQLLTEGADILDIGGESTRPFADVVSYETERERVIPFLKEFRKIYPNFPVSLDTKKFQVAQEAVDCGVQMINDVSFLSDTSLLDLVKKYDCYYVLMHSQGDSQTMQSMTEYPLGVVQELLSAFSDKISFLRRVNFDLNRLILDPGFGFAKTPDQCVEMIENLPVWLKFNFPLMFAVSRKRFLQKYTGENPPRERDEISADLSVKAYKIGFKIIRTHNVALAKQKLSAFFN